MDKTLALEPLPEKFKSFHWNVETCSGHDIKELRLAFSTKSNKPKAIICYTEKGYPIDFMRNKIEWHYKSPSEKQLIDIEQQLESFYS